MQRKQHVLGTLIKASLCAILALGIAAQARAEDKKADPTGTWTWTGAGRGGNPGPEMSLKLKADGDKVLAKFKTLVTNYLPIENPDAPLKNPEPKTEPSLFTASLTALLRKDMADDQKKWNGEKQQGRQDREGETESERNGEPVSRDWEAKRKTS